MESSNATSDFDEYSEESETSLNETRFTRPNRFTGPKATWRQLVREERLLYTSMAQARDQNLSVHLYNAHSLKRRHYEAKSMPEMRPWSSKDRWRRETSPSLGEDIAKFVPPKSWTAWPLSADLVPRQGEEVGADDGTDIWTLRKDEVQQPSHELEDLLIGSTLRHAKNLWKGRHWENYLDIKGTPKEAGMEDPSGGLHFLIKGDAIELPKNPSIANLEKQRGNAIGDIAGESNLALQPPYPMAEDHQEGLEDEAISKGSPNLHSGSQNWRHVLRPSISADDAKSRSIIRPTIRHSLSQLDDLLMALHNARQTCLCYASERTDSQTEGDLGYDNLDDKLIANPSAPPSPPKPSVLPSAMQHKRRGVGRPRKNVEPQTASALATQASSELQRKSTRGRKRKLHEPLEGESQAEMLTRIARTQKKPLPFQSSAPTPSKSSSPSKAPRDGSRRRGTSAHARESRSARLGLRDWSEVLGTAALIRFPPEAVTRATKKCATLFGEGMKMVSLVENSVLGGDEDQTMLHLPDQILDLGSISHDSTAESDSDDRQRSSFGRRYHGRRSSKADIDANGSKEVDNTTELSDSFFCPYNKCIRQTQPFISKSYLIRHLKRVHNLHETKIIDLIGGNDEEMEGGVHVDGFLKEIMRKRGWRGADGKRRQRSTGRYVKKVEGEEEIDQNDNLESEGKDEGAPRA